MGAEGRMGESFSYTLLNCFFCTSELGNQNADLCCRLSLAQFVIICQKNYEPGWSHGTCGQKLAETSNIQRGKKSPTKLRAKKSILGLFSFNIYLFQICDSISNHRGSGMEHRNGFHNCSCEPTARYQAFPSSPLGVCDSHYCFDDGEQQWIVHRDRGMLPAQMMVSRFKKGNWRSRSKSFAHCAQASPNIFPFPLRPTLDPLP